MSTRNEPAVCRPEEALDCFLRTTRLGRTDFARKALEYTAGASRWAMARTSLTDGYWLQNQYRRGS